MQYSEHVHVCMYSTVNMYVRYSIILCVHTVMQCIVCCSDSCCLTSQSLIRVVAENKQMSVCTMYLHLQVSMYYITCVYFIIHLYSIIVFSVLQLYCNVGSCTNLFTTVECHYLILPVDRCVCSTHAMYTLWVVEAHACTVYNCTCTCTCI